MKIGQAQEAGMEMAGKTYVAEGLEVQPASAFLISSITVIRGPGHDYVRVWSRGALTGGLIMEHGDGALLAEALGLTLGT
jgi:hypothetical protein